MYWKHSPPFSNPRGPKDGFGGNMSRVFCISGMEIWSILT